MTIDEAIEYFKKEFPDYVFEEPSEKQLAYNTAIKALEELKDKDCSKCSRRSWYQKGYANAIDDFAERLKTDYVNFDLYYILQNNNFAFENTSLKSYQDMIDEIAEELKGR